VRSDEEECEPWHSRSGSTKGVQDYRLCLLCVLGRVWEYIGIDNVGGCWSRGGKSGRNDEPWHSGSASMRRMPGPPEKVIFNAVGRTLLWKRKKKRQTVDIPPTSGLLLSTTYLVLKVIA
jgi:hypothetical protein